MVKREASAQSRTGFLGTVGSLECRAKGRIHWPCAVLCARSGGMVDWAYRVSLLNLNQLPATRIHTRLCGLCSILGVDVNC